MDPGPTGVAALEGQAPGVVSALLVPTRPHPLLKGGPLPLFIAARGAAHPAGAVTAGAFVEVPWRLAGRAAAARGRALSRALGGPGAEPPADRAWTAWAATGCLWGTAPGPGF